nr:cytochrome 89A2 [Tanacetum cinerariifolium]
MLKGYCDANWISNHNEGKSKSGYVFTLGGVSVSWKSSKQTVNTRSTMKAEFVALDKAAEEAEWLRSFLEDLQRQVKTYKTSPQYDKGLVKKRNHFHRLRKVKGNIADPLTKGLCREQVIFTSRGMGLKPTQ